jgi:hypothetical protein
MNRSPVWTFYKGAALYALKVAKKAGKFKDLAAIQFGKKVAEI